MSPSSLIVNRALIGRHVKSHYGQYIGQVIGLSTDIDCKFELISVDCGTSGIKQLQFSQFIIPENEGDALIFVPKWKSDAANLVARKTRILERMKALNEMISEEDASVREDAASFIQKYERRLREELDVERTLVNTLKSRTDELNAERKQVELNYFEGKLLFKSREISEDTYEHIKAYTGQLIDQINSEMQEIAAIEQKLKGLATDKISLVTESANVDKAG
jgi:hypothetical protein